MLRYLSYTILTLMLMGLAYLALVLWRNRRWKPDRYTYRDQNGVAYGELNGPRQ